MNNKKETAFSKAKEIINRHKGIIRTKDAIKAGIHPEHFINFVIKENLK